MRGLNLRASDTLSQCEVSRIASVGPCLIKQTPNSEWQALSTLNESRLLSKSVFCSLMEGLISSHQRRKPRLAGDPLTDRYPRVFAGALEVSGSLKLGFCSFMGTARMAVSRYAT